MIALTHFNDAADFEARATRALVALSARPGYVRGTLGRSIDDDTWILLTEWDNVGSYRRALGGYEVKLHATPLLATALDLPSAFEALVDVSGDGTATTRPSDREPTQ
jgi:hypothetical protein